MNFGVNYPSGITVPAIRPERHSYRPAPACYHVVVYDVRNPDDTGGFLVDTMRHREQALCLVRGRSKTMERHGYERVSLNDGQAFFLVNPPTAYPADMNGKAPRECYLVTILPCSCNAKVVEDAPDGANHLPPLPSRGETV
jgi:hypothetical protein